VHCGDLGERLTPDRLVGWEGVDALVLPVGGYFTLGPAGALELMHAVGPRFAVPCHYRTAAAELPELLPVERFVRRCARSRPPIRVERRPSLELEPRSEPGHGGPTVVVLESLGLPSAAGSEGEVREAPAGG
jgi:L-ascorbate metabolism protein UlaG (beta-lactamase superfamily)